VFSAYGRPTIRQKGREDYITTVSAGLGTIVSVLIGNDYQRNTLSTVKYRSKNGRNQWTCGAWVYDRPNTHDQHDVYLFHNADGTIDIYGHKEASVRSPSDHNKGKQEHGDPDHRLSTILARNEVQTEQRDTFIIPSKMKHKKKKKTMLGIATSLAPTATVFLVRGQYIEGAILLAMSVGLFLAYDYYDDKAKEQPRLPEGIDAKLFEEGADVAAEAVQDTIENHRSSNK